MVATLRSGERVAVFITSGGAIPSILVELRRGARKRDEGTDLRRMGTRKQAKIPLTLGKLEPSATESAAQQQRSQLGYVAVLG